MIISIPNNKNNSDVRKDLHCKHRSDAYFEIANELIDSYEDKKMMMSEKICNANSKFALQCKL